MTFEVRAAHKFGPRLVLQAASVRPRRADRGLTVGAGAGGAVVDLLLAVKPCVSCGALAEVASLWVVDAAAVVGAGPIGACHCAQLTVVAVETVRASAGVSVF